MSTTHHVTHNRAMKRYEMKVNDKIAYIDYAMSPDKIFLTHTEVPKGLEGQGVGSELVKLVLEEVKQLGKALMPLCPFVAAYIKKHPTWKDLLAPGVHVD